MNNYIKLGEKTIDIDKIENENDLNEITNACIRILGVTLVVGTNAIPEDKERVERILKLAGEVGGKAAEWAILIIANTEKKVAPEKERHDA